MKQDLPEFLGRLMRREDLSRAEAGRLLESLLNGEASDAQIAAALVALKLKGETTDELQCIQCHFFFDASMFIVFAGKCYFTCLMVLYAVITDGYLMRVSP